MKKSGKQVSIIASSDLTHYGPAYEFTPFPAVEAKEIDKKILKSIANLEMDEFQELSEKTTVCGHHAILTMMSMMEEEGKVLKYTNSSQVTKDKENFVGYGSVAFK